MRISDWSSDVCSSDLLNHEGPRVLQHAIFRLQRPALIEMVIHALGIEEVLNPVARQNEADVAHDFAGGIVDADGVDLGEDHADDVAAAVQQRTAAVALADVSSHDDGGAARTEGHTSALRTLISN